MMLHNLSKKKILFLTYIYDNSSCFEKNNNIKTLAWWDEHDKPLLFLKSKFGNFIP